MATCRWVTVIITGSPREHLLQGFLQPKGKRVGVHAFTFSAVPPETAGSRVGFYKESYSTHMFFIDRTTLDLAKRMWVEVQRIEGGVAGNVGWFRGSLSCQYFPNWHDFWRDKMAETSMARRIFPPEIISDEELDKELGTWSDN